MDKELNRLLNDYLQKKQALNEAETRLWAHLAEKGMNEPLQTMEWTSTQTPHRQRKTSNTAQAKRIAACITAFIAVAVTLCIIIFTAPKNKYYARINGKTVNQNDLVEQYAADKLHKAELLLSGCLNPLDNLQKVKKGGSRGGEALTDIQETLYNIYYHLPLKTTRHEEVNDSSHVSLPDGSDHKRTNA